MSMQAIGMGKQQAGSGIVVAVRSLARGLAVCVLLVGWVAAQPGPVPMESGPGRLPREKMEALLVWRVTEELGLTEEQSAEFLPRLQRAHRLRGEQRKARQAVINELATALSAKPMQENRLKVLIDSLGTMEVRFQAEYRQLQQEMLEALSVEQQARWLVLEDRFERETRRMIQQIRQGPGPRRR